MQFSKEGDEVMSNKPWENAPKQQSIPLKSESQSLQRDLHVRNSSDEEQIRVGEVVAHIKNNLGKGNGRIDQLPSGRFVQRVGKTSTPPCENLEQLQNEVAKIKAAEAKPKETRDYVATANGTLRRKNDREKADWDAAIAAAQQREQREAEIKLQAEETAKAIHRTASIDSGFAGYMADKLQTERSAQDIKIADAFANLKTVLANPNSTPEEKDKARQAYYLAHW